MKRALAFSLVLFLIFSFSACKESCPQAEPSTSASPHAEVEPVFSLPELPEIGGFVPDTTPVKSFFPDGPAGEFIPRDDYGELIPYIADATFFRSRRYETYTDEEGEEQVEQRDRYTEWNARWGLAAADGRAVTKGLYTSAAFYAAPSGKGIYVLRDLPMKSLYSADLLYTDPMPATVIDGEGRWALDFPDVTQVVTLFDAGLPVFAVFSRYEKTALLYDLDGNIAADLSDFVRVNQYDCDFPGVVGGNKKELWLRRVPIQGKKEKNSPLVRVDWNGNILAVFDEELRSVSVGSGKAFIGLTGNNTYVLLSPDGERLTAEEYIYLGYSRAEKLFVGRRETGPSASEAVYFNEKGRQLRRRSAWTNDSIYALHGDYAVPDGTGATAFFLDDAKNRAVYDLFGNQLPLPAQSEDIRVLQTLSDPAAGRFLFVRTKDGENYLCAEDGRLLAETVSPKTEFASGRTQAAVYAQNGRVFIVTPEGDLVVYAPDGSETARIPDFFPNLHTAYVYIDTLGENFVAKYTSTIEDGVHQRAYELTLLSPSPKALGTFAYVQEIPGGGLAAVSKTQSVIFTPGGEELLRFTLPDFY